MTGSAQPEQQRDAGLPNLRMCGQPLKASTTSASGTANRGSLGRPCARRPRISPRCHWMRRAGPAAHASSHRRRSRTCPPDQPRGMCMRIDCILAEAKAVRVERIAHLQVQQNRNARGSDPPVHDMEGRSVANVNRIFREVVEAHNLGVRIDLGRQPLALEARTPAHDGEAPPRDEVVQRADARQASLDAFGGELTLHPGAIAGIHLQKQLGVLLPPRLLESQDVAGLKCAEFLKHVDRAAVGFAELFPEPSEQDVLIHHGWAPLRRPGGDRPR
mmetsp:Transcript_63596/g.207465  ORF Transcript_63596/g.207465 Transcript_63596/m.207465 type:complete len:274 (+) Transcript_63596:101-922(+)